LWPGCGICPRCLCLGIAVSGEKSVGMFATLGDHLIAVEPDRILVDAWHDARQATGLPGGGRVIGQIPVCWDLDRNAAVKRAYDQFRWFGGGWHVNADLPTTAGFAGATQFVRPEDVAESIPCGPDLDGIVGGCGPAAGEAARSVELTPTPQSRGRRPGLSYNGRGHTSACNCTQ
jgi:hypothetical protein